ncbi:hypothetical protein EAF04_008005 [Stromatinia cepivora]|nr:hypothetical protein EAF04_008005 [Stromatinia cepivora]
MASLAGKTQLDHIEDNKDSSTASASKINPSLRVLQPPEWIAALSPEERLSIESKLKRKIDIRLLPMVIIMYIMNYLDRNNIAAARLAGMEKDLKLVGDQYQTCVSILFVGYLLMQIPSNLFLNKLGTPATYLPTAMIIWGVISAATAGTHDFIGLLMCRFFLGFVEAAYFPGCLYYLSCWYTRKELGLRTALLFSGSLISGAFSGLIAAGITEGMDGVKGLLAWRWLFIIEGSITVVIAAAGYFIIPNFPRTTAWLTEQESELAVWRLEEDVGMDDWVDSHQQTFMHGLKLAFTDIKTYILMLILFGIVAAASVTNFFPTVVATLNYNRIQSLLLTAPPYVLALIASMANAWHADKTGERFFHIAIPLSIAFLSFILAAATTSTAPRYVAMMLMVPGCYTAFVVALAWISNTLPRPPAKRAVALAFINTVSNSSSIYASYMYPSSAGPRYIVAMSVNCGMVFMAMCAALTLRTMLVRLNKKLDRGEMVDGAVNEGTVAAGQRGFRYKV